MYLNQAELSARSRPRSFGTSTGYRDLPAMLRGAWVEYAAWKDAYRESGAGAVQADILELEAQTTRIAEFQPGMISGLLQTSEYAREFQHLACGPLSYGQDEDEIDRMVAKRMQRRCPCSR